jgi:hypothetical protein
MQFLDDKMNEFLCHNKELFSSKREFLTKLREVRQKLMNTNNLKSNEMHSSVVNELHDECSPSD